MINVDKFEKDYQNFMINIIHGNTFCEIPTLSF